MIKIVKTEQGTLEGFGITSPGLKKELKKFNKKSNIKMNKSLQKLETYHWYDMSNSELVKLSPVMFLPPEYPSTFESYFGTIPVVYTNTVDKILVYEKYRELEKYLLDDGFMLMSRNNTSFLFIHPTRKMTVRGDIVDPIKHQKDNEEEDMISGEDIYIGCLPTVENKAFIETLLELLDELCDDIANVEDKFYMICQNQRGLFVQRTRFKSMPIADNRFDIFYGQKFPHDKIKKFIDGETDHLLLLHGDPGTGKSNYIKHLISSCGKKVIYIPPSMLSVIASPGFIPFMMENKDSILLIEDAEEVLTVDRNSATNNLLGLTDGFLKDALNLKVIATFNCKRDDIDPALLRKGRLYFEYKFDKLSVSDCKSLSEFTGFDRPITEPMTLAEFFKVEENTTESNFEEKRMGFGAF